MEMWAILSPLVIGGLLICIYNVTKENEELRAAIRTLTDDSKRQLLLFNNAE